MNERLHEYFGNIHMHTVHSDGTGSFDDLVQAAAEVGLDFVFVTDHNVLVREEEEGYRHGVLTLVGQEVHDPRRKPPGNHLLCLGVEEDVTHLGEDPQTLIDAVNEQGGLPFLAHPIEISTALITRHYSWHDWNVTGYRGVELWNYMSSFRPHATSKTRAVLVGYFPHLFTEGPLQQMLARWDELLAERRVVAIGGTDVHAQTVRIGIFERCFLPYAHCAQAVNTHILTEHPLRGPQGNGRHDLNHEHVRHDRRIILEALAAGHCWVGYDLAGPTQGFRFWARNHNGEAMMGDKLTPPTAGATAFHISLPANARMRLLRNGTVVHEETGRELRYESDEPGVYRVEARKRRWGKQRGWIFSNPIYVR